MTSTIPTPRYAAAAFTMACMLVYATAGAAGVPASRATTPGAAQGQDRAPACRLPLRSEGVAMAYRTAAGGLHGYNQGIDMRDDTGYNTAYLFAMTKGVAASSLSPVVKPLLFLFTVPLDIVTLPFTAIGGFF